MFGKPRYTVVKVAKKKDIPEGLWTKCEECGEIIYNKALEENMKVCPKCNYHFVLTAAERITMLLDAGSFEERDASLRSLDPLQFKGPRSYEEKLKEDQALTGMRDACLTGRATIDGKRVIFVVTDSRFMMGSMGSVVGEKITRAVELSMNLRLPLVVVSGSGGGARMQESLFSLMQMAKTSAALAKLHETRVPYISVLTNPTMGGIMASFASLGDIIIAEPRALIGFAGPRVIEQTIRQKLPPGFQRSEFLLEHGLLDAILHRKNLKAGISQFIDYLS